MRRPIIRGGLPAIRSSASGGHGHPSSAGSCLCAYLSGRKPYRLCYTVFISRNIPSNDALYRIKGGKLMRVLGIISSPRKGGNSELAAKEILRSLPEEWEKAMVNLYDLNIKNCTAC